MISYLTMLYKIIHSKIIFGAILLLCMFTFPRLISWANIKTFKSGEAPPNNFLVAVSDGNNSQLFKLIPFGKISRDSNLYINKEGVPTIQVGEFSSATYHLIEWSNDRKIIETISSDDDYTFTSKYEIRGANVTPLTFKVFGPGHMFQGVIVAIIFCYLLFYFLRRHINGISKTCAR